MVDDESSPAELSGFQRRHPAFVDVEGAMIPRLGGAKLLTAEPGGKTRLLVSVSPVEPARTLEAHMRENLTSLERAERSESELTPELTFDGPTDEVVSLAGGEAWRLRWSYDGGHGRVRLVQYTFVREGLTALFTYSTLRPYEEAAELFDRSSRTIRLGGGRGPEQDGLVVGREAGRVRDGRDGNAGIDTTNAGGSEQSRLTRDAAPDCARWSPVRRRDGSGQRPITETGDSHSPSRRP